jgi:hypothetical protein
MKPVNVRVERAGDAWQALPLPGAPRPGPGEVVHPAPWHRR